MLYDLSTSDSLWERKIAIMPTFYFTKKYQLAIHCIFSEQLLRDQEDLIHKTVGWMLREVRKRNLAIEVARLRVDCQKMPRTILRCAIENSVQ